jgi:hypothetical protein
MVHLLAAIATDAEHMPSLLYSLKGVLTPPEPASGGETWGVGYYADDQALTIRKPGELVAARNFYDVAAAVKSRVMLAMLRQGTTKTIHAPPHRFRRWLFGTVGSVDVLSEVRSKILDAIPDFIKSELNDAGPSELSFGMFLRELHQKNLLSDPLVDGSSLAGALKRTVEAMTMLTTEGGVEAPKAGFVATNGRVLLSARTKGGPVVCWRLQEGLEVAPGGPTGSPMSDPVVYAESLKRFRALVIGAHAGGPPPGWKEIPDASTLWVDRTLAVNQLHA